VEATSLVGHRIQAGGHLAWLDATYDGYIAVAVDGTTGDVSGNSLINAPALAGRLWIEWTGDIGHSRRVSLSAESSVQSTVFFTPFNDSIQRQSPYGLLGARVEYGPGHRRWTIGAYARNLTNTDYVTGTFGTPPTAYAGRPAPSRQFALEFAVRR
jgi:outer membrane receptor protein involved in Fe transport